MSVQTPLGVVPAIKTVSRTIEVAVLETTLGTVPQTKSDAQTQKRVLVNQIIAGSSLVRQASGFS
jgi:hypothetical protein